MSNTEIVNETADIDDIELHEDIHENCINQRKQPGSKK